MPDVPDVDVDLADRLGREVILWLTTVRSDGQPQSVPVWFLWDGQSFLIYSQRGKPKLRNIAGNPKVSLHLRGTDTGGDVVVFEGIAERPSSAVAADRVEPYMDKYRHLIDEYGWSPASFADDYPEPIRITPTALRRW
jgi:PPOX class probable F420-dependent enzyme